MNIKLFILVTISILFGIETAIGQRNTMILYYKDGTVAEGEGLIRGNKFVKFWENNEDPPRKIDLQSFEIIKHKEGGNLITYELLNIKGKRSPSLMRHVIIGKVSLYRTVKDGYPGFRSGNANSRSIKSIEDIKKYYLKKEHESEVTYVGSNQPFSKSFIKSTTKFFEDCPELTKKIKLKEYKKKDLQSIVRFYNTNCQ